MERARARDSDCMNGTYQANFFLTTCPGDNSLRYLPPPSPSLSRYPHLTSFFPPLNLDLAPSLVINILVPKIYLIITLFPANYHKLLLFLLFRGAKQPLHINLSARPYFCTYVRLFVLPLRGCEGRLVIKMLPHLQITTTMPIIAPTM